MYEIWLVMNILWEIGLSVWPVVVAVAMLWLVVMVWALRTSGAQWRRAIVPALLIGVVVGAFFFFSTPGWTKSSLSELKYWVDWANLLAIGGLFSLLGAALAWPAVAVVRREA